MRFRGYFLMLCTFLIAMPCIGEEKSEAWKFTSVAVSAGEDALSSGITGSVWLENEKKGQILNAVVQHEQGWIVYGRRMKWGRVTMDVAGSAGHFQGAPWAGPYLAASMPIGRICGNKVSAGALHWPGVYLREPDSRKGTLPDGAIAFGSVSSAHLNIGRVALVFSELKYLRDPWNPLPGIAYTQKIRKDFALSASVTRNVNAKRWMYYVGTAWSPSAK